MRGLVLETSWQPSSFNVFKATVKRFNHVLSKFVLWVFPWKLNAFKEENTRPRIAVLLLSAESLWWDFCSAAVTLHDVRFSFYFPRSFPLCQPNWFRSRGGLILTGFLNASQRSHTLAFVSVSDTTDTSKWCTTCCSFAFRLGTAFIQWFDVILGSLIRTASFLFPLLI